MVAPAALLARAGLNQEMRVAVAAHHGRADLLAVKQDGPVFASGMSTMLVVLLYCIEERVTELRSQV